MSFFQSLALDQSTPLDYVTPQWPSLYWPFPINGGQESYLYHSTDIWKFTLIWTLLFFGAVHLATSLYACAIQRSNWKLIWIAPVLFTVLGGIEAVIAGSIVGGLLSAVYNAGYFKCSTWIPFVWAGIVTLAVILSGFAIQGGL